MKNDIETHSAALEFDERLHQPDGLLHPSNSQLANIAGHALLHPRQLTHLARQGLLWVMTFRGGVWVIHTDTTRSVGSATLLQGEPADFGDGPKELWQWGDETTPIGVDLLPPSGDRGSSELYLVLGSADALAVQALGRCWTHEANRTLTMLAPVPIAPFALEAFAGRVVHLPAYRLYVRGRRDRLYHVWRGQLEGAGAIVRELSLNLPGIVPPGIRPRNLRELRQHWPA